MLRKLLITSALVCVAGGAAFAADLPNRKSEPVFTPPPPPAFTWTGLYIGAQVGYQWGSTAPSLFAPGPAYVGTLPSNTSSGVVGGAHIGYNYQVSQIVFGLEGDVDGSNFNGGNATGALAYTTREPVEASIRGRLGFAWDRVLIYGTGGVAFGDFNNTYTGPGGFDSTWDTRVGWTAGGGIEYAVTDNWSLRAEYRYTDFGRFNDSLATSIPGDFVRRHETDNRVQVGFSYKFDMFAPPGPIATRY
jgi:outer membrane immunogenic protein